jgi:hypothetical protein
MGCPVGRPPWYVLDDERRLTALPPDLLTGADDAQRVHTTASRRRRQAWHAASSAATGTPLLPQRGAPRRATTRPAQGAAQPARATSAAPPRLSQAEARALSNGANQDSRIEWCASRLKCSAAWGATASATRSPVPRDNATPSSRGWPSSLARPMTENALCDAQLGLRYDCVSVIASACLGEPCSCRCWYGFRCCCCCSDAATSLPPPPPPPPPSPLLLSSLLSLSLPPLPPSMYVPLRVGVTAPVVLVDLGQANQNTDRCAPGVSAALSWRVSFSQKELPPHHHRNPRGRAVLLAQRKRKARSKGGRLCCAAVRCLLVAALGRWSGLVARLAGRAGYLCCCRRGSKGGAAAAAADDRGSLLRSPGARPASSACQGALAGWLAGLAGFPGLLARFRRAGCR